MKANCREQIAVHNSSARFSSRCWCLLSCHVWRNHSEGRKPVLAGAGPTISKCQSKGASRCGVVCLKMVSPQCFVMQRRRRTRRTSPTPCGVASSQRRSVPSILGTRMGLGLSYVMEHHSFEANFPWRRTVPEGSVYGLYHPKVPT